jgi:hypothetical protein
LSVDGSLRTNSNEPKVLGESGTATGELQVENQLAIGHPLDDGTIMRTGTRGFVSTPYASAHRFESPPPALSVTTLRLVPRRHRVEIRAVRPIARRDRHFSTLELTRRRSSRLPVALEQSLGGVRDVAPKLVECERVEPPFAGELGAGVASPEESRASDKQRREGNEAERAPEATPNGYHALEAASVIAPEVVRKVTRVRRPSLVAATDYLIGRVMPAGRLGHYLAPAHLVGQPGASEELEKGSRTSVDPYHRPPHRWDPRAIRREPGHTAPSVSTTFALIGSSPSSAVQPLAP